MKLFGHQFGTPVNRNTTLAPLPRPKPSPEELNLQVEWGQVERDRWEAIDPFAKRSPESRPEPAILQTAPAPAGPSRPAAPAPARAFDEKDFERECAAVDRERWGFFRWDARATDSASPAKAPQSNLQTEVYAGFNIA